MSSSMTKARLFAHVPEDLQLQWASKHYVKPCGNPWKSSTGPSLEVGRALFKGSSVHQATLLVTQVTNPEVLLHVARTDKRVTVARALLESPHFPHEGLSFLLERFEWDQLADANYLFNYTAACENGLDRETRAAWNSVSEIGYIPAIEEVLSLSKEKPSMQRSFAMRDLLHPSSNQLTKVGVSPEEYLDGILHVVGKIDEFSHIDNLTLVNVVPSMRYGFVDTWQESPGCAERLERIVRAVAALDERTIVGFTSPGDQLFEQYEFRSTFSGPLPDVSHLLTDRARATAFAIRCVWSRSKPLEAEEMRTTWGYELLKSRNGYITAEAALEGYRTDAVDYGTFAHRLTVVDSGSHFNTLLTNLEQELADKTLSQQARSTCYDLRRLSVWIEHNLGLNDPEWRGHIISASSRLLRLALKSPFDTANDLLRIFETFRSSAGLRTNRRDWQKLVGLREQAHLYAILDAPGADDSARQRLLLHFLGAFPDDRISSILSEKLTSGQVSGWMWLMVLENLPRDYQEDVVRTAPNKLADALRRCQGVDAQDVAKTLRTANTVCVEEALSGNYAPITNLRDALVFAGLTVPDRIEWLDPRTFNSGAPAQEVSPALLCAELEKNLGADPTAWQLAVELLSDWEGDVPSLLDTITALSE